MLSACSECAAPLVTATSTAPAEAEVGTVRGTREGPTTWACPEGHEQRRIDADAAVAEVVAGFDVARRPRLRPGMRCGACDAALLLPGRRTLRSVTVVDAGVPATRLTFDVPVLRCTEDAIDNLPPECVSDLQAVVRAVLAPGTPA